MGRPKNTADADAQAPDEQELDVTADAQAPDETPPVSEPSASKSGFDPSQPHGKVHGGSLAKFFQNDKFYDANGQEVHI